MRNKTLSQTTRRQFLRVIGGVGFTSFISPGYVFGKSSPAADGLLVEASAFTNPGGWKIDTQHYHQMGGNYLLAHGLGVPCENAATDVEIPDAGEWKVWVRNRDWCKGNWESPGRFKVRVNGQLLEPTFGTGKERWHWENGGTIRLGAGRVTIELEDLTGFDGRCDAIFLTREEAPELPNEDLVELSAWKDRLTGRAGLKIEELSYDLVVVGGGMTGCGAALAAKSKGLKVALIQDRPLFGGNASEEVRVHTIGIHGYGTDILKTIDTAYYPNGHAEAIDSQKKREATMAASGVDLFPHHVAIGLEKKGDAIQSVEAREVTTGVIKRLRAPVFVDATGDGWLGFWGGAEFREGREAHTEFGEAWDRHGNLWSPDKPDMRVMGTSVLWNAEQTKESHDFPELPWAAPVAKHHKATKGEWNWEYSDNDLDQIYDAEQIRDHLLRAIYGSFANAKEQPRNATWKLKFVAYVGGKRESRRLMGDHIYTMQDAVGRREFADAVVVERRELDTHYQRSETGDPLDFLSQALFHKTGGLYYIPFRSLYSKDISNLMMAGRCFSCSHIGLSGPRVMNTCGQMGIATGFAAVLCKQHQATPREVGKTHIAELRELIGFERRKLTGNPSAEKKHG